MDFFELEVFCEFADGRIVLAHASASGVFIVEFQREKYFFMCRKKKYRKSMKRTKNFTWNYDVVDTASKQWMWRRLTTGRRRIVISFSGMLSPCLPSWCLRSLIAWLYHSGYKPHTIHNSSIRSDQETSNNLLRSFNHLSERKKN